MIHHISFKHAWDGIWHTFTTQPNLRFHVLAAVVVTSTGLLVGLTRFEWLIILFTILWVFVSEMINTSIEAMTDLISKEYHQEAKIAKDVAAGMVLIGAAGSVIVGLAIFLPYFI